MKAIYILLTIVMTISVAAGLMGSRLDNKIMAMNNRVKITKANTPIRIKGVVYYVTKEQEKLDKVYMYIFLGGFIFDAIIIILIKMKGDKIIDWERYWENRRDWMKNKK